MTTMNEVNQIHKEKCLAKEYLKNFIHKNIIHGENKKYVDILELGGNCRTILTFDGIKDNSLRIRVRMGLDMTTGFYVKDGKYIAEQYEIIIYGSHVKNICWEITSVHNFVSTNIDEFADHVMSFRDDYAFDKYDSKFHKKTEIRSAGELAYDKLFLNYAGECCVCTDLTKSLTVCCLQHYCLVCFHTPKKFPTCPMCRNATPFTNINSDSDDDGH